MPDPLQLPTPQSVLADPNAPQKQFAEPCLNCDWRGRIPPARVNRFSLTPNVWTEIPGISRPSLVKPTSFLAGKLYARAKGVIDSGGGTAHEFAQDSGCDLFLHAPGKWEMFYDTSISGATVPVNLTLVDHYHYTGSGADRVGSWSEGTSAGQVIATQNVATRIAVANPRRRYIRIHCTWGYSVGNVQAHIWIDNTVSATKGFPVGTANITFANPLSNPILEFGITTPLGLYTGELWAFSTVAAAASRTFDVMDMS